MTVATLINDLMIAGVFLGLGFVLREVFKPLQRLFLPASVIGGLIALAIGPQVLGWIDLPKTFPQYSGALIGLIMTTLIFGVSINAPKLKSYLDYSFINLITFGMQLGVGVALGAALMRWWPGMPEGWGSLGVFSFYGGHGTAGATGAVFEQLGVQGNVGVGMILSTIGLIVGIVVGMIIINIGARRGWTQYISDPSERPSWFYGGVLPKEEQHSLGVEKVNPVSINGLALQFAFILISMFVGYAIFKGLAGYFPFFNLVPTLIYGMVGALIVWPIIVALKKQSYVDKKSMNSLAGLFLEIIIVTAIASLDINLATTFAVPILLFSAVSVILTTFVTLYLARRFCQKDWFEKAMLMFGANTGNTSLGLALLRTIDPKLESDAAEAHGVYSGVSVWINFFPAFIPGLVLAGLGIPLAISAVMVLVPLALGWFMFSRKQS